MSRATHNHKPVNEYTTPVPMLDGRVVFHIAPHTPLVDIHAYRISKAIKAGSQLYLKADEDEQAALDKWVDELPILLELTTRIDFLYQEGETIPAPVAAFKDFWEAVQKEVSDITLFEYRCEHVSGPMMAIWNAAYTRGQMPLLQPASKPGDVLTKEEREAVEDPASPLAEPANNGGNL